jgi:hypothetical protein
MAVVLRCGYGLALEVNPLPQPDELPEEATIAWSEAERMNRNVEIEVECIRNSRQGEYGWVDRQRIVVKSRGEMVLSELTESPPEGSNLPPSLDPAEEPESRVDAINNERSFSLRRNGDRPWVLNSVGEVDDSRMRTAIERRGGPFILWPWNMGDWSLPEMYRSRFFHVQKVERVHEADQALVRLSFMYSPGETKENNFIRSGWVLLNPKRHWCIERCQARLEHPNGDSAQLSVANEYRGSDDSIPLRTRLTLAANAAQGIEKSIDFVKYERHLVPADQFTLAAYGIETSLEGRVNWTPWSLLNVGVILLLVGIILYRRLKWASEEA